MHLEPQPARPLGRFLGVAAHVFGLRERTAFRSSELARLRVLEALHLLDTLPEPFLDAVVSSAATIANTPVAALSLIDADRQWFKGSFGLEVSETTLERSFCRHTLADARPLVVPDTRLDARFASDPTVADGLPIRFYAGFPLVVGGLVIGALCVADDHPRRLSSQQHHRLGELAAGAVAWIETHAAKGR